MSEDWKDQLKHVYKNLQQDQKNKKGLQSKFDKTVGYKNKTVLPIWLVIILLAIISYFLILYYLHYRKIYKF